MRKVLFILGQLTDSDVEWLSGAGERVRMARGTVVIPHGSRVNQLSFVLGGQLLVRAASGAVLARLESGEIIGEMSLVDPAPTSVAVEVAADATLLRLSHAAMNAKLAADLGFASRFYYALCVLMADRMRHTTARMGYGNAATDEEPDELGEDLLDNVHLAGARFDRLLKRLAG